MKQSPLWWAAIIDLAWQSACQIIIKAGVDELGYADEKGAAKVESRSGQNTIISVAVDSSSTMASGDE